MALSGSLNTTNYDGRYLKLEWTAEQSVSTNTSTISWSVVGAGEGGVKWYMAGPITVVIDGKTVYSSSTRIQLYEGTKVASGTLKIEHNPDGSKSFSASVKAAIYEASINCSGSKSWILTDIPRAATITSAPDFNDEENPKITYSNLLGSSVKKLAACISLTGARADVPYRDIDMNGTEYTFNLTDTERNTLRAAVSSGYSVKVYFYVRTTIGEDTYYNKVAKTFTIINGEPKIAPTIVEGNPDIAALTGSTAAYIANASIINYEVNPSVYKGATIKSISVQYGNYKGTTETGTISNVSTTNTITFTLTDSRNNKATVKKTLKVIAYTKPVVSADENTLSTTATEIYLTVNCSWKDIWFDGTTDGSGGGVYNTATLYYRYKLQDGEYGEWIAVESGDFSGHDYEIYIDGLDSNSTYVIQTALTDKLTGLDNTTLKEVIVKMTPVFDWGKDDFNFNVPVSIKGEQLEDYVIEQGTESMGSNGTWYWRKWHSGRADCWGVRNYGNMAINTAWGALYTSGTFTQSLPSELFAATPGHIDISINRTNTYSGWVIGSSSDMPSKDTTGGFRVCRAEAATAGAVYISFNVIGRWK